MDFLSVFLHYINYFLLLNKFVSVSVDNYLQVLSAHLYFTAFTFGTAAGAGLTGTKVARRIGDVEEFEFKKIGDNHNQGVSFFS